MLTAELFRVIKNKTATAASFKKLQPEEFYRHYIEKVRKQG